MTISGEGKQSGTPAIPRFCPRCRKAGGDGQVLCAVCGETMAMSGFCPVCDTFLSLAPGDLCPKHDLELDVNAPPRQSEMMETAFTDWVRVASFPHSIAAEAPRIRLEAEGIPVFLDGERMGSQGAYSNAVGGTQLLVPRQLEQEARVLLSQSWSLPFPPDDEIDGESDVKDAVWDEIDGEREWVEDEAWAKRREVMKGFIVLFLISPAIVAILLFFLWR